jgi:hypothetical protein
MKQPDRNEYFTLWETFTKEIRMNEFIYYDFILFLQQSNSF